jgi:hypothetical protein
LGNKKSQNSIVFLTTLGVYLGLLIVGASPGVLAQQAAMTRNFDVNDEIEAKDDLDRDPNGCDEVLAEAIELAPEGLSEYAGILQDIASTLVRYEADDRSAYQEAGADPFNFYRSSQSAVAEILARTRIIHRKDQIFIVTRLPRAALDPLLGLDAK